MEVIDFTLKIDDGDDDDDDKDDVEHGLAGCLLPSSAFSCLPRLTASQWPLCIYRFPICNFVFVAFLACIFLVSNSLQQNKSETFK